MNKQLRADILNILRASDAGLKSNELYEKLGTTLPRPRIMGYLASMKKSGQIKMLPGNGPRTSLYALGPNAGEAPPQGAKTARKQTIGKRGKQKRAKRSNASAPKPTPRVTQAPAISSAFIPAITADKRMLIVGIDAKPLIFSVEETLAIADLVFQNFEV